MTYGPPIGAVTLYRQFMARHRKVTGELSLEAKQVKNIDTCVETTILVFDTKLYAIRNLLNIAHKDSRRGRKNTSQQTPTK